MTAWIAAAAAAMAAATACAGSAQAGPIEVRDAVLRAAPAGVPNTAGYMTIVNSGPAADRLVSAECACARRVEIHVSHVMNGMAMMMPATTVEAPAGGLVAFRPGGYHLMVMGLKAQLKDGESQAVTLKFAHAGAVRVSFVARSRIELPPPAH